MQDSSVLPLNHTGCYDIGQVSRQAGVQYTPANTGNATGVKAYIRPTFSTFKTCTTSAGNDFTSAWVALASASGGILQIGIIRCNSPFNASCTNNEPRYFWARGGCSTFEPVAFDLGTATSGDHLYKIRRYSDANGNYYELTIDNNFQAAISVNHSAINCWIGDDKIAYVASETLDTGDTMGTSTNPTWFQHMKYYNATADWDHMGSDFGGHSCGISNTPPASVHTPTCFGGFTTDSDSYLVTWSS